MDTHFLHSTLLLGSIIAPLLAGVALLFGASFGASLRRSITLAGFGIALLAAVILAANFDAALAGGYNFETKIDTGLSAVGIFLHLGLNGISLPLFLLAGVVGLAAGLYALHSKAERPHLYLGLLLIMQAGLMGTFASIDIFFFYFFHEFALIPTFIMIGIWGGAGRRAAAMEMAVYLTLGALLSLIGLIALYANSGAESFSLAALREHLAGQPLGEVVQSNIFALLFFGFGILVAIFPLHSWAPKAYAMAPTGAVMLHAGVLKKFGLYGLLQIAAPLLPDGAANWFPWIAWMALGNLLLIGLVTLAQRDLKMMLGYSSVMHMGYAFLGIATFSAIGVGGAVLMMVAHGLSVALLFMLSTCIHHRCNTFNMDEMGGLASKAPLLSALFVAATMASIGLPGFGNFVGEFVIFVSLGADTATRWLLAPAALGIVLSAIYGLRAVASIFFGPPSEAFRERWTGDAVTDLQNHEKLPAVLLLASLLFVGLLPGVLSGPASAELTHLYPEAVEVSVFDQTVRGETNAGQMEDVHE